MEPFRRRRNERERGEACCTRVNYRSVVRIDAWISGIRGAGQGESGERIRHGIRVAAQAHSTSVRGNVVREFREFQRFPCAGGASPAENRPTEQERRQKPANGFEAPSSGSPSLRSIRAFASLSRRGRDAAEAGVRHSDASLQQHGRIPAE